MVDAHDTLDYKMRREGLPSVNYRISSDYGIIMTAKTKNSFNDDIFGPTVNICSKINLDARPNSMVIGGDLYQLVKSLGDYRFESMFGYHGGLKLTYPVYSVSKKV